MLYQAAIYPIITIICLWSGLIFYSLFRYLGNNTGTATYQRPLINYLLSGLMLITALGQWIVLLFPLGPLALLACILPVLILLSFLLRRPLAIALQQLRSDQPKHSFFLPCLAIFVLMILVLNAGPTVMDDTDTYHIQIVKWAQEYGTVPGISNLHIRFGVNSSWLLSIALLMPNIKGIDHYITLNGLLSCWLCHYLLQKIFAAFTPGFTPSRTNTAIAGIIILTIGLIAWPMIRGNATGANYDFISACCIIVLCMEAGDSALMPEWILWPVFLCTVKLINFAGLFFCLLMLIRYYRRQILLTYLAVGSFIFIPFVIRNVLLSGYPLFPLYQVAPFDVDWKTPRALVKEWMDYTLYFNRSNGSFGPASFLPFPGWIRTWHTHLVSYDKALTDLSLLCWLLVLVRWKKLTGVFSGPYKLLVLTLLLTLVIWFFTAPDPRFIYGVLIAGIFIFIQTLPPLLNVTTRRSFMTTAMILLSVSVFIYSGEKILKDASYRNWLWPHALPVPAAQRLVVDGIEIRTPEKMLNNWNPRCFDLPLPCLYTLSPLLRARGKDIRNGFRMAKDQQEEQLTGEFKTK